MITITKEQLIASAHARIEFAEMMQAGELEPLKERTWSIVLELARIALASIEAEAVGEVVLGEYDDCGCHPNARVACIAADGQADWENFKDGTRLYTAPPASAVNAEPVSFDALRDAVAEVSGAPAMEWSDIYKGHQALPFINFNSLARIVDKFRAAMLQGADGNSTAGWVACSERMPEREIDVQVYCSDKKEQMVGYMERNERDGYFRFSSLPNGVGIYCQPTHWMPLPAAPQQEAKNV